MTAPGSTPTTEDKETPRLAELIDAHKRAYGASDAELARRIEITRQNRRLRRTCVLPARTTLDVHVLENALRDSGYLDNAAHIDPSNGKMPWK